MHPVACLNKSCYHLLKQKEIQIYLESVSTATEDWSGFKSTYIGARMSLPEKSLYMVKFSINYRYHVVCIFEEDDFNPTITCSIDEAAGIKDWEDEDKKQCARFIYLLYEMYKLVTNKRVARMNDPVDDYIFSKTQRIERRL